MKFDYDPMEPFRKILDESILRTLEDVKKIGLETLRVQTAALKAVQPAIDASNLMKEIMQPTLDNLEKLNIYFSESIKRTFKQLEPMRHLAIPIQSPVLTQLSVLVEKATLTLPKSDSDSLNPSINVTVPTKSKVIKMPLSWGDVIQILMLVITIYIWHVNSIQSDIQYREILEQKERHHIEQMEQKERHHLEHLETLEQTADEIRKGIETLSKEISYSISQLPHEAEKYDD